MSSALRTLGFVVLGIVIGGLIVFALMKGPPSQELPDGKKLRAGVVSETSTPERSTYTSDTLQFSITYPSVLVAEEYDEGEGAWTVLFQEPGQERGFQIFVTPYQGEQITEARVKADLKGATMRDAKEIIIGQGTRAVLFTSDSPVIGESREVWFLHEGFLYEATTYAAHEAELAEALETLRFR